MTEHHNTLLINGKGQGKEGSGHDAFAEVSYELLNRIRIVDVKVEQNQVVLRGDATAAYLPELGLKKFVRDFVYRPGSGFSVTDEVETNTPADLTWLLHADDKIEKGRDNRFTIFAGSTRLLIDPVMEGSKDFKSSIEPNDVTAPGPPGAVDKGERQVRGQKLVLSTSRPVSKTQFSQRLKIEN